MKDWELTDELNKVAVRFFRGTTTSQVRWHVKPTIEKIRKSITLHCGTNDVNDDSKPQNIAEEFVELAKSITNIVTVT